MLSSKNRNSNNLTGFDALPLLNPEQLKQYLERVGLDQSVIDDTNKNKLSRLELLCKIHHAQAVHVHITNFDMQDKSCMNREWPISPYFEDIFQKIVIRKEHGYCFENNLLLRQVLLSLDYELYFYNAYIIRNHAPKEEPQHVFIIVKIEEKEYLVDAGYGGVAPIPVCEFKFDLSQTGVSEPWATSGVNQYSSSNLYKFTAQKHKFNKSDKLEEKAAIFWHYYRNPNYNETSFDWEWKPLYIFRRLPVKFEEFIDANEQVCKNKETTPFKTSIFETAFFTDKQRRISLTQNEITIVETGELIYTKPVLNQDSYKRYLVKYLGHDQTVENRRISDRVIFNKPSEVCNQWYRFYKKQKNNNEALSPTVRNPNLFKP